MTVDRMLEYLVSCKIVERYEQGKMVLHNEYILYDKIKSLEDEFVNEYKLPET